ncbi:MAG: class I SAM-dependent methyltransferase [Deltaproteobacteria bacterium]|nr:class I SAM-dependent methyltransferase [Deltaproteobacteria bacterium]
MKINAKEFDHRARTVFGPVYPLIADQILAYTGINQGTCLDLGCGGGYLGLALARKSDLYVHFLDQSSDMLEIVNSNLAEAGLAQSGTSILANVEEIPLPDASVNLAVSRGSVFFWEDLKSAFSEVYRVLAPGGMTYIGGGFGSAKIKEDIGRKLDEKGRENGDKWRNLVKRNMGVEMRQRFLDGLQAADIPDYEVRQDLEEGTWIVIRKQD